jgi:post-segregation antitoxin (ccd killing protein)
MMLRMKERVTISVEPDALQVARDEVEAGRAPNVSAAVEEALRARSRRQALLDSVEMWEEEFGPIGEEATEWARRELKRTFKGTMSSTPEP